MYPPLGGINRGGPYSINFAQLMKLSSENVVEIHAWRRCWIKKINWDFPQHSPAVPWIKLGKGPWKKNQEVLEMLHTPQLIIKMG